MFVFFFFFNVVSVGLAGVSFSHRSQKTDSPVSHPKRRPLLPGITGQEQVPVEEEYPQAGGTCEGVFAGKKQG